MEEEKQTQQELHDAVLSENGVISDKFDGPMVLPQGEDAPEMDGDGIEIEYDFTSQEIKEALVLFQKKTIYRKNLCFTLVVAILFFLTLARIIGGDTSGFQKMICIVSICVIGMIWYFPLQHIRQVVKAMQLEKEPVIYHIGFYANGVRVGAGESASTISFADRQLQFWETETLLVLGYAKQRLFALPKRCFPEQVDAVRAALETGIRKSV